MTQPCQTGQAPPSPHIREPLYATRGPTSPHTAAARAAKPTTAVLASAPWPRCGKVICPRVFKGTVGVGLRRPACGPWEVTSLSRVVLTATDVLSALSQTIMEQFNPSLRTFIAMGKNYEKALAGEAPRGPGRGTFRPGNVHGRAQALSPDVCPCGDGGGTSCSVARAWGLGSVCHGP